MAQALRDGVWAALRGKRRRYAATSRGALPAARWEEELLEAQRDAATLQYVQAAIKAVTRAGGDVREPGPAPWGEFDNAAHAAGTSSW